MLEVFDHWYSAQSKEELYQTVVKVCSRIPVISGISHSSDEDGVTSDMGTQVLKRLEPVVGMLHLNCTYFRN